MTAFVWVGGRPALDLCNTAVPVERLVAIDDLAAWVTEAGLTRRAVPVLPSELADVRALRDAFRVALPAGDGAAVGALAERWLEAAPGCLCVDRETLEPRFSPAQQTLRCILVPVVLDALEIVRAVPGRVRRCAAEGCGALYLDTSRNGSRRWCSMERCGARAKAATYYRRHRAEGAAGL